MPQVVWDRLGKVVIVNLQKTPLDNIAEHRIHAKCDDVMTMLMNDMGFNIPPFILNRTLSVSVDNKKVLRIGGTDVDGLPVSFVNGVQMRKNDGKHGAVVSKEPFEIKLDDVSTMTFTSQSLSSHPLLILATPINHQN